MTKEDLKDIEEITKNANAIIIGTDEGIKLRGKSLDMIIIFYLIVTNLIENGIPLDDLQMIFNEALTYKEKMDIVNEILVKNGCNNYD